MTWMEERLNTDDSKFTFTIQCIFYLRIKGQLTGFPGSPGLPENPISPGRPFIKKQKVGEHSSCDIWIIHKEDIHNVS